MKRKVRLTYQKVRISDNLKFKNKSPLKSTCWNALNLKLWFWSCRCLN